MPKTKSLFALLIIGAVLLLSSCAAETQTAEDYFKQGNEFFQAGKLLEAQDAFQKAIDLDGKNPSFFANLGVSQYSLGKLDEAEKTYLEGLKLAPDDSELNYLLGAVYLQTQRLADAQSRLQQAVHLNPDLPEPYFGLGVLYRLQGNREEAIKAFEKFLEIGPGQDPQAIPEAEAQLNTLRAGQ